MADDRLYTDVVNPNHTLIKALLSKGYKAIKITRRMSGSLSRQRGFILERCDKLPYMHLGYSLKTALQTIRGQIDADEDNK